MTRREDGRETRGRILEAAGEIFAQKGYREARVADICRRAAANLAAVNYYFGGKRHLYRQVWQHALRHLDVAPPAASPSDPSERLRLYIHSLIRSFAAGGGLGRISRLYLMELANPSGLVEDSWQEIVEPRRRALLALLRDIVGPQADELSLRLCELSIVNQCRSVVTLTRGDLEYLLGAPLGPELLDRLAAHVADFSLAGIRAVGRRSGAAAEVPRRG